MQAGKVHAKLDLLVTGFGPFPHVRVNPTTALAGKVAERLTRAGWNAQALILETSYAQGLPHLSRAIAQEKPRAILMLGLAARARFVRIELMARGRASILHPDASGATPAAASARAPALPARMRASADAACAALRRQGIRTRFSPSAGRYLCDASYALALSQTAAEAVPVIFIHVPWLRPTPGCRRTGDVAPFRPTSVALVRALAGIGAGLARQGRANAVRLHRQGRHGA